MEEKKINDVIHYKYVVGILTLIIITLLTFKYAPDTQLSNYVSFAATISSLILAVLAIIQGFLSTNSLSDTVTNMNQSSREILDNSDKLQTIISDLDSRLREIPAMIKGLEDKITTPNELPNSAKKDSAEIAPNITKQQADYFKVTGSVSNIIAIYVLYMSSKTNKSIVLSDFVDMIQGSTIDYLYGTITTCNAIGIVEINVVSNGPTIINVVSINENFKNWDKFLDTYILKGHGAKFKQNIIDARLFIEAYFSEKSKAR